MTDWPSDIVIAVIIIVVAIGFITLLGFCGDRGFATEEAIEICSGDNMELSQIWGVKSNRCWVRDCENTFDGIKYCKIKTFMVSDGYFLG